MTMHAANDLLEEGTVLAVEGPLATVRVARCGACSASCAAAGSCMIEAEQQTIVVQAVNRAQAQEGDVVRLALHPGRLLGMAALAYLMPLLFLFLGAFAGPWLSAAFGLTLSIDLARGLTALLGLALGLVVLKIAFARVKPTGSFTPVVIEIVR